MSAVAAKLQPPRDPDKYRMWVRKQAGVTAADLRSWRAAAKEIAWVDEQRQAGRL